MLYNVLLSLDLRISFSYLFLSFLHVVLISHSPSSSFTAVDNYLHKLFTCIRCTNNFISLKKIVLKLACSSGLLRLVTTQVSCPQFQRFLFWGNAEVFSLVASSWVTLLLTPEPQFEERWEILVKGFLPCYSLDWMPSTLDMATNADITFTTILGISMTSPLCCYWKIQSSVCYLQIIVPSTVKSAFHMLVYLTFPLCELILGNSSVCSPSYLPCLENREHSEQSARLMIFSLDSYKNVSSFSVFWGRGC